MMECSTYIWVLVWALESASHATWRTPPILIHVPKQSSKKKDKTSPDVLEQYRRGNNIVLTGILDSFHETDLEITVTSIL